MVIRNFEEVHAWCMGIVCKHTQRSQSQKTGEYCHSTFILKVHAWHRWHCIAWVVVKWRPVGAPSVFAAAICAVKPPECARIEHLCKERLSGTTLKLFILVCWMCITHVQANQHAHIYACVHAHTYFSVILCKQSEGLDFCGDVHTAVNSWKASGGPFSIYITTVALLCSYGLQAHWTARIMRT